MTIPHIEWSGEFFGLKKNVQDNESWRTFSHGCTTELISMDVDRQITIVHAGGPSNILLILCEPGGNTMLSSISNESNVTALEASVNKELKAIWF